MYKSYLKAILAISLATVFGSCDSEVEQKESPFVEEEFSGKVNSSPLETLDPDQLKVYPLPTPLQAASVLKSFEFDYNEGILISPDKEYTLNTRMVKALVLGMNTIDLGYTVLYEQNSMALKHFSQSKKLMGSLNLDGVITNQTLATFEQNMNNKDSLSFIILKTYEQAHSFFANNKEEGLGLIILTGGFLEGLHIATNVKPKNNVPVYYNLIGQHKLYIESIIELLSYYERSKEVYLFIEELKGLQKHFNTVELDYSQGEQCQVKNLNDSLINEIRVNVGNLRAKVLGT